MRRVKAVLAWAALLGLASVAPGLSVTAQEIEEQNGTGSRRLQQPPFQLSLPLRLQLPTGTRMRLAAHQTVAGGATKPATDIEVRALTANTPLERELGETQVHAYTAQLDSGQYLHVTVDQRGVDVVVSLAGPDGAHLAEIDSPSGRQGIEPLFWVAESPGTYHIEVRALEKNALAGKYQIRMDAPRAATAQDRDRVRAQRTYTEGRMLARQTTEGSVRMTKLKFEDALRQWQLVGDRERAAQTLTYLDGVYAVLAGVLRQKGHVQEAFQISQEHYEFIATSLGENSINLVHPLRSRASIYESQGNFAQAAPLRKQELSIAEKSKGENFAEVAASLGNLAHLYALQGQFAVAEPLLKRAVTTYEKAEGHEHPDVAKPLLQLGVLYRLENKYPEAEQVDKRALAIVEKSQGIDGSIVSIALSRLAKDALGQQHYPDAEEHEKRALAINEKTLGPEDNAAASTLNDLAEVYMAQRKYADAEPLYQRALANYDKNQGLASIQGMQTAVALVGLYAAQGKQSEAEPHFLRIKTLLEKSPLGLKFFQYNAAQKYGENFQYVLGVLYDKGLGVKQDYGEALNWYRMAAAKGIAQACKNLGNIYENGLGIPKNNVEAYKWYSLAGPGHEDWAAHKKALAAQLTKDQLDEAQRRVAEWQKLHPSMP